MACCSQELFIKTHDTEQLFGEFICVICGEIMTDPVLLDCRKHSLGKECAILFFKNTRKYNCPVCNTVITNTYTPNCLAKNIIGYQVRKCHNIGCTITLKQMDLDKHLKDCKYQKNPCKLCNMPLLVNEIDDHNKICEYRKCICDDCKSSFVFKDKTNHDILCPDKIIVCQCQQSILKKNMTNHREIECQEEPINCDYCINKVPRKSIDSHKTSCIERPWICIVCKLQTRFSQIENHNNICPEKELLCVCTASMKRKELDTHKSTVCPDQKVDCKYCKYCDTSEILRKNIDIHMKDNLEKHLIILETKLNDTQIELTDTKNELEKANLNNSKKFAYHNSCFEVKFDLPTEAQFDNDGYHWIPIDIEDSYNSAIRFIIEFRDNCFYFNCLDTDYNFVFIKGRLELIWCNRFASYDSNDKNYYSCVFDQGHIPFENTYIAQYNYDYTNTIKMRGTLSVKITDLCICAINIEND
jgi:hypothetical protein